MTPEPHNGRGSRSSRVWLVVLTLVCLGILAAVLTPTLLVIVGFGQAMSSFAPSSPTNQPPRGFQVIVFIIVGALPLLVYLLRRRFSQRRK